MLLAVDIGNTNITLGLFEGERLLQSWRLSTHPNRTEDEYRIYLHSLLSQADIPPHQVQEAVLASVVPSLTATVAQMVIRLLGTEPLVVGPGTKTGVSIHYQPPTAVGADRVVNAAAAFHQFRAPCIVVDFGTATTFDCIGAQGEYLGGAIAPGVELALSALLSRAAKLPKVELARPERAIGRSPVESIQSGSFFGYVSLVDGLVLRILREMNEPHTEVVATGGLARSIASASQTITAVDEDLTLKGLMQIHGRNRKGSP